MCSNGPSSQRSSDEQMGKRWPFPPSKWRANEIFGRGWLAWASQFTKIGSFNTTLVCSCSNSETRTLRKTLLGITYHILSKVTDWVDDVLNFPFGGICDRSLEGKHVFVHRFLGDFQGVNQFHHLRWGSLKSRWWGMRRFNYPFVPKGSRIHRNGWWRWF